MSNNHVQKAPRSSRHQSLFVLLEANRQPIWTVDHLSNASDLACELPEPNRRFTCKGDYAAHDFLGGFWVVRH